MFAALRSMLREEKRVGNRGRESFPESHALVELGLQALGVFLVVLPRIGGVLAVAGGGEVAAARPIGTL